MQASRLTDLRASLMAAAVFLLATTAGTQEHQHGGADFYYPENDEGIAALPARKAAQLATAGQFTVFHGFQFSDRLPESGITFRHAGVDDARWESRTTGPGGCRRAT